MKHGPIALIDEEMPVVVIIPNDNVFDKTLSNLKEVESRNGRIIAVTDHRTARTRRSRVGHHRRPATNRFLMPVLTTMPLQLLAYHIACIAAPTSISRATSPNPSPSNSQFTLLRAEWLSRGDWLLARTHSTSSPRTERIARVTIQRLNNYS